MFSALRRCSSMRGSSLCGAGVQVTAAHALATDLRRCANPSATCSGSCTSRDELVPTNHFFAKRGNVRHGCPSVPGVERDVFSKLTTPNSGCRERALQSSLNGTQAPAPILVKRFQQRQRNFNGGGSRFLQFCPAILVIRFEVGSSRLKRA